MTVNVYARRLMQARRLLKQKYGSADRDVRTSEARGTWWDLPDGTRLELVGWSDGKVGHVAINYDSRSEEDTTSANDYL